MKRLLPFLLFFFTLNSFGQKNIDVSVADEDRSLSYRKLERHSNMFHLPSYDELMEAISTENHNQVNEDGEKIGIWIQVDSEAENSPFRVFNYELDENNQSNLTWFAQFSVDSYLILDEIVIRTGKNDLSSIPGEMYYDTQGVHIIKD